VNPNHFLTEVYRVLKLKGVFRLITDNVAYWRFYLKGFGIFTQTHVGGYSSKGRSDLHYEIYTMHHLENHLKRSGFQTTRLSYFKQDVKKIDRISLQIDTTKHLAYPRIYVEAEKPGLE
jgi:tRNA G46 methylase TrmB